MILKSKRNIESEGIKVDYLYPVIECKKNVHNGEMKYRIYDNYRSFSWKTKDNFIVESDKVDNYEKKVNKDEISYFYRKMDSDFYNKFYLENDESVMAVTQLENAMVNIITDEMSVKSIMNNINELGFSDEAIEIQLKAFFKKAKLDDVIKLANNIYDNVLEINSYLLEIIISNMKKYKSLEIENLFVEIYMNSSCNEKTIECINDYLQ